MVNILLMSLKKVTGPSYVQLLEHTPWQRYLKRPPSSDPSVVESNDEEFSQVCAYINEVAGTDLFIAFGRYAGVESGKVFAGMLGPAIAPAISGLTGVARLQRMATLGMSLVPWDSPFIVSSTPDGVEVLSPNWEMCSRIKSSEPVCAFIGDTLRSSYAMLIGEQVLVKEVKCRAQGKGSDCVFRVTLG